MTDVDSDKSVNASQFYLLKWIACILFSAIPLLLFFLCLDFFTSNTIPKINVSDPKNIEINKPKIFSSIAGANGSISLFNYAITVFFHVLVCVGVGFFFLMRFSSIHEKIRKLFVCFLFFAFVTVILCLQVNTNSPFKAYMIDPIVSVMDHIKVPQPSYFNEKTGAFLKAALIVPTSLGVLVVILASGAFHARVLTENHDNNLNDSMSLFRQDLIALSLVLVSSALTAHVFFNIPQTLFASNEHVVSKYYESLSSALSSGSGILFSATLIAAFAPGYFILMTMPRSGTVANQKDKNVLVNLFDNFKETTAGLKKIWKSVIALLAPVIVSPIFDLVNNLLPM